MNRRLMITAAITAFFAGSLFAQDDPAVVITSPSAWATLRGDSVVVSIQADPSRLPRNSVDFKVVRRSGVRSSALFSRSVRVDDVSVEAFLGRIGGAPLGGTDFIRIEWSVPGTDVSGVIEPVGVAKLRGEVADGKWIPAPPPLRAIKIEGGSPESAADALALSKDSVSIGGASLKFGWNKERLFMFLTPGDGLSQAEFAFDPKCGKNAFLSWADRFAVYTAQSDSVHTLHGDRLVDGEGIRYGDRSWGLRAVGMVKSGPARLITIPWPELGLLPFEGRNIGFSVFTKNRGGRQTNLPAAANRHIPGTWGDIRLEK